MHGLTRNVYTRGELPHNIFPHSCVRTRERMNSRKALRKAEGKGERGIDKLTGSKTSIWQSKWTASCVAWLLRLYSDVSEGGFCALLSICVFAPSHAYLISSRLGEPSSSVISSSYDRTEDALLRFSVAFTAYLIQFELYGRFAAEKPAKRGEFLGLLTCCTGLWAWKRIRRRRSSPKMQPTLHTSTAAV